MFNSFMGCDKASSFAGKGEKTAFDTWKSFDEVTYMYVFSALFVDPLVFNDDCMYVLEKYVVLLYDRTCTKTTVVSARKQILTAKGRSIDKMAPTATAHKTGDILRWTCVGTGTGRFSSSSISRDVWLAKECNTRLAAVLDNVTRSGGVVFCIAAMWV